MYNHGVLRLVLAVATVACAAKSTSPPSGAPSPAPAAGATWPVPAGWKHERIDFPLEFAPTLAHRGVEELRFPPGFLDEASPHRWSYVFVWRLEDAANLDATALGNELVIYFRGLLTAVDDKRGRLDPTQITATATARGNHFELSAHIIDTFTSAQPVDLTGHARRMSCGAGSLWTFVLAPPASPIRAQLDELARAASCDQPVVPNPAE